MASESQKAHLWAAASSAMNERTLRSEAQLAWEREMQNSIIDLQAEIKQLRQELRDRDLQLTRKLEENARLYSSLSRMWERLPPTSLPLDKAKLGERTGSDAPHDAPGTARRDAKNGSRGGPEAGRAAVLRPGSSLRDVERDLFVSTLSATGGNRTRAAQMLGVSLRTVRNKIREYGLPPRSFHSSHSSDIDQ